MSEHAGSFTEFFADAEPRLRRALAASLGPPAGSDAASEALTWAWEHWVWVQRLENPVGYLYRVGQSRSREKRRPLLFPSPQQDEPWCEPGLGPALGRLSERQRLAVVLIHGFGWTHREVAETTGISITSVQNHLERGLRKLRRLLGVDDDESG